MKRIYASLALLAGISSVAVAQNIDLAGEVVMKEGSCLALGQTIQADDTTAPAYGLWGVVNNGPETLLEGDQIMYVFPMSTVSETGVSVWLQTVAEGESVPAGEIAFAQTGLPVDSIKTLLDIDAFEGGGTTFAEILVPRAELVNGNTYGFYLYVIGIGTDPNSPDNTDTVGSNNFPYVAIQWNDCASSIEEMIVGKDKVSLVTYPNPAQASVGFDYNFAKASNTAVAKITDVTGRVVLTQDFGKAFPGKASFKMDISSLNAGMYIIEFSTDNERAVSKFNVSK